MAKLNIHGVLAIMGRQSSPPYSFFLTGFNLEKRIGEGHIMRMISEKVGFNFTYYGFYANFWCKCASPWVIGGLADGMAS
jgi:hypothetical protein